MVSTESTPNLGEQVVDGERLQHDAHADVSEAGRLFAGGPSCTGQDDDRDRGRHPLGLQTFQEARWRPNGKIPEVQQDQIRIDPGDLCDVLSRGERHSVTLLFQQFGKQGADGRAVLGDEDAATRGMRSSWRHRVRRSEGA